MAAAGQFWGPEYLRYPDPATELEVVRLTNPAFASGMTAPPLRQFARRENSLLCWSERSGARQAFLTSLKDGSSRQLTDAAALDPSTLSLSPDERSFLYFDGAVLYSSPLSALRPREIYRVPQNSSRMEFAVDMNGAALFVERSGSRSRVTRLLGRQSRAIVDIDAEIQALLARPRRNQALYRTGGTFWLVNADGSGRRQLKIEPGKAGEAMWIPSGRTFIYLHIPDDPKELITLREHVPDDGTDKLVAKTSQFISAAPNADASVFVGASGSRASAYVLILLRVTRRELTLCEHHASDPRMVNPLFSPDSQNVLFVSDRHGKPAVYLVPVSRFVEETNQDAQ